MEQNTNRLTNSEEHYRALVIATSDGVYRMSADWRVMYQLQGGEFLPDTGKPIADWMDKYIHPKDRDRVQHAIDYAIRTKTMFQLEHQVVLADGTLGWTYSRAIPILDSNGEITEWFGAAMMLLHAIAPRKLCAWPGMRPNSKNACTKPLLPTRPT